MTTLFDNISIFNALVDDVQSCRLCPRMIDSARIFGLSGGRPNAELMFIGEAPGRLGADDTAIPFHGDRAGENFERLIKQSGISRYDCFITNAVLCNPKDEKGNNATPLKSELTNCSGFLKRQIDHIQPLLVVTLGNQALQALKLIESHSVDLAGGVRHACYWYGRSWIPLYHPGQRAMLHRSFLNQLADYRFVAEQLNRLKGSRKKTRPSGKTSADMAEIVSRLLKFIGSVSYFRLHKLAYMLEYHHVRQSGERLTNSYVIRQKDGPYFTELHVAKLKKAIPQLRISNSGNSLRLSIEPTQDLLDTPNADTPLSKFILEIVSRYKNHTDEQLKTAVYMTAPMRNLLRREKYDHENLFNAPINFLPMQGRV